MNKKSSKRLAYMTTFLLSLLLILSLGCAAQMDQVMIDTLNRLDEYTTCPEKPLFGGPVHHVIIDGIPHHAITIKQWNALDKYILALQRCSAELVIDVISRNKIIEKTNGRNNK